MFVHDYQAMSVFCRFLDEDESMDQGGLCKEIYLNFLSWHFPTFQSVSIIINWTLTLLLFHSWSQAILNKSIISRHPRISKMFPEPVEDFEEIPVKDDLLWSCLKMSRNHPTNFKPDQWFIILRLLCNKCITKIVIFRM